MSTNTRRFPRTMDRVRREQLGVQLRVEPTSLAYLTHVGERTCKGCGHHECSCTLPRGFYVPIGEQHIARRRAEHMRAHASADTPLSSQCSECVHLDIAPKPAPAADAVKTAVSAYGSGL